MGTFIFTLKNMESKLQPDQQELAWEFHDDLMSILGTTEDMRHAATIDWINSLPKDKLPSTLTLALTALKDLAADGCRVDSVQYKNMEAIVETAVRDWGKILKLEEEVKSLKQSNHDLDQENGIASRTLNRMAGLFIGK